MHYIPTVLPLIHPPWEINWGEDGRLRIADHIDNHFCMAGSRQIRLLENNRINPVRLRSVISIGQYGALCAVQQIETEEEETV